MLDLTEIGVLKMARVGALNSSADNNVELALVVDSNGDVITDAGTVTSPEFNHVERIGVIKLQKVIQQDVVKICIADSYRLRYKQFTIQRSNSFQCLVWMSGSRILS